MGQVVPIRTAARRRSQAPKPEGSAQILFFLGVRYQRHEEDSDAPPKRSRAGAATPRSRRKKRA